MNRFSALWFKFESIRTLFVLCILSVVTIAVYHEVFSHSFINYDDTRIISNRIDRYDGINLENINDIIFYDYPREEPLIVRDLTYLVNAELFGVLNPLGYLIGNLILHVFTAYLIYRLTLILLPEQFFIGIVAAAVFAIHPMNVESVAWISSRKNPLFAVFLLLSLFGYIKYLERAQSRYLIISALLYPIALLSKTAAICLFPILISYRFILKREFILRRQEILYYSIIIITTLLFIKWYTGIIQQYGVIDNLLFDRNWVLFILSAFEYITFYVTKLIAPFTLSAFYSFPSPSSVYSDFSYLFSSLILIALCLIVCIYYYKSNKNSQSLFLVALFVCALTPYLGLAEIDIFVADRYAYISSASYSIGIVLIINYLYKRFSDKTTLRVILLSFFAFYCILLGARTLQATTTWKSTFSFWLNAYQSSPDNIHTSRGLMKQYSKFAYEFPENQYSNVAIQNAKEIGHNALERFCPSQIKCKPGTHIITSMLGNVYALEGNHKRSEHYYNITFRVKPDYIKGRYQYALDLIERQDFQMAMQQITYIESNANRHRYAYILDEVQNVLRPMIPVNIVNDISGIPYPAEE